VYRIFSRDFVAQIELKLLVKITESLGVSKELWIRTTEIAVSSAAVNTLDTAGTSKVGNIFG
jgi:hypothetical protein